MAENGGGERTEKATPRRREKAREKGQVAKSMELNSVVLLACGLAMLSAMSSHFTSVLGRNSAYLFSHVHVLRPDNVHNVREILVGNLEVIAAALLPLVAVLLLVGFAINALQVGVHLSPGALAPQLSKLNPIAGMKRFFQKKTAFELVKNLAKIGVIATIAGFTLAGLSSLFYAAPLLPLAEVVQLGRSGFAQLVARLLAFLAVLAVVDWFWQKSQYEDSLKMSKYEVKQELKDVEGDPQIKARIRGLQLEMARKRMLADVPQADVVVTNPTHFAVALKYVAGESAPVVVAKGKERLAEVIKKIARQARVPVIENRPLARELHARVEVGQAIPGDLFQAVAEVLAYVYRLRKA